MLRKPSCISCFLNKKITVTFSAISLFLQLFDLLYDVYGRLYTPFKLHVEVVASDFLGDVGALKLLQFSVLHKVSFGEDIFQKFSLEVVLWYKKIDLSQSSAELDHQDKPLLFDA